MSSPVQTWTDGTVVGAVVISVGAEGRDAFEL
jgi:hypothetical protein